MQHRSQPVRPHLRSLADYVWPDLLAAYVANGGNLRDLEPTIPKWIAERLEQRAQEGHEAMRSAAYTGYYGKFERKHADVVASYRGLMRETRHAGAEAVLERMACREEAFTRYEAELVADESLCEAVQGLLTHARDRRTESAGICRYPS